MALLADYARLAERNVHVYVTFGYTRCFHCRLMSLTYHYYRHDVTSRYHCYYYRLHIIVTTHYREETFDIGLVIYTLLSLIGRHFTRRAYHVTITRHGLSSYCARRRESRYLADVIGYDALFTVN